MIEILPNWHPLFVHFTIALFSIATLLFFVAKIATNWRLEDQWLAAAYWNLWFCALISIGTVLAGWYAYNTVSHDTPSHLAMTEHRNWAIATFTFIVVMAVWALMRYRAQKRPSILFLAGMVVGFGLVATTGFHGGEVVYRHGLGVMSLPKKDTHGHAAGEEHGDGAPVAGHHDAVPPSGDHHDESGGAHSHDEPPPSDSSAPAAAPSAEQPSVTPNAPDHHAPASVPPAAPAEPHDDGHAH